MGPQAPRWYAFRWQAGLVLALLLSVLLGVYWRLAPEDLDLPPGQGPAGPPVPSEPFQSGPFRSGPFRKVWRTGPVVLLGLGDSITRSFGARPGRGYFELLIRNDDAAFPDMEGRDLRAVFPELSAQNHSASYSVSAEHLEKQVPAIEPFPPEVMGVVVITTGGNDLMIHDYGRSAPRDGAMYGARLDQAGPWVEGFRHRLRRMLEEIQARFPGGSEVFLASIYDPTDGVGDIANAGQGLPPWPDGLRILDLMNRVIAETCRELPHVHLVDLHRVFLGHGIHCRDRRNAHHDRGDPCHWYHANLEDPNERGYDAIRRHFLLEMVRVFAIRAPEPRPPPR